MTAGEASPVTDSTSYMSPRTSIASTPSSIDGFAGVTNVRLMLSDRLPDVSSLSGRAGAVLTRIDSPVGTSFMTGLRVSSNPTSMRLWVGALYHLTATSGT